jgi:pimeloyl-ACP methyl ester carboxylesterase
MSTVGVGQSLYEVNGGFNLVILRKEVPDEKLAALRCPVLILRGGEDNIVSPEKACDEWRR